MRPPIPAAPTSADPRRVDVRSAKMIRPSARLAGTGARKQLAVRRRSDARPDRRVRPAATAHLRALGNRERLHEAGVQARLEVDRPGDRWEREAEGVAESIDAGGPAFGVPPAIVGRGRERAGEVQRLPAAEGSIDGSLPVSFGLAGGVLAGGPAGAGWSASFFADATFQHPVLHLFQPALRLSMTMAGVPESGAGADPDQALFFGVLPGFRIADPRPSGGTPTFSLFGGPSFNFREDQAAIGAQVGATLGYQWSLLGISAGPTYVHDPTAVPGARNLLQLGASIHLVLP